MPRRPSSLGFFGIFGRSSDLRQLDQALRAADLHPALVPEGVKLTIVNLMKDHAPTGEPPAHAYLPAAQLFAFCVLGPDHFERMHGQTAGAAMERRIEAALDQEGFDAQLILLALHAKLIRPELVERYGLSADEV